MSPTALEQAVEDFLESSPSPRDWEFPSGGNANIATETELRLSDAMLKMNGDLAAQVKRIRSRLSLVDSYSVGIFAVRMSILAVRTTSPERLNSAALALTFDDDLIDWRDLQGALALIETSAQRLGVDLHPMLNRFISVASPRRRNSILSYMSRPGAARLPEMFGFDVTGGVQDFAICHTSQVWSRAEMARNL